MNAQFFNINRFKLQLKRDLFNYRMMLLVLYGTIAIPYLLKIIVNALRWSAPYYNGGFQSGVYYFYLFLTLIILSATAFRDFRSDLTAQSYLMLPSSTFEKFLSMWFLVFIINPIAVTLAFFVVNGFFVTLSGVLTGDFHYVSPADLWVYGTHASGQFYTLFLQVAAFFAGAATFKKDAWLKTYLVEIVVMFAVVLIMMVTLLVYVKILGLTGYDVSDFQMFNGTNLLRPTTLYAKAVYFIGILALFAIAYFKIKEKEV